MKIFSFLVILGFLVSPLLAVELQRIPHRVVAENRLHVRDATDRRYNVWTEAPEKAAALLVEFGLKAEKGFALKKGEVLAIILNDRIEEDVVDIVINKSSNDMFADCADSGIVFKLRQPPENKKHTHATAVVFTPPAAIPGHLGMRSMMVNGLSEKH